MKSSTTDVSFMTKSHYEIPNGPDFLNESFKMHLTKESKTLYNLGAPGQGYVGLVDLVDREIHLVPCFNKDDGLLRVDIDGNPFTTYVESAGPLGQLTGDLHQKACEKLNLWVSDAKQGKGDRKVLGFGVWKQGTALKFLDDLPKPAGLIPDEFIFTKDKDNNYQLFYIDFDRKTHRFEISKNPELCEYLKTCASEGKPIDRKKIETNLREHYKQIIKQTSLPFKSAKNRSTSQNSRSLKYSEEYKAWFIGRNRGHTAHQNDLIRELPFDVFKKILNTIFQDLGFRIIPLDFTHPLFPKGTDGIADHFKLEMDWMNPAERQQRLLEYALIKRNESLIEEAINQGGKISRLPMDVLIDYAIENNKKRVIQLMVDYAIRHNEGTTTLVLELKKKMESSAQIKQPFKKFLSEKIILLEENEKKRNELIDKWADAAKHGKLEVIQKLLEEKTIDPNLQLSNGATALYMAAEHGKDEVVNALLTKGVDRHLGLMNEWNPLLVAAEHCHMKVIEVLMQNTDDLCTLLTSRKLNTEQKAAIFNNISIRTKLPQLIANVEDFFKVCFFACCNAIDINFEDKSMQDKIAQLSTNMDNFVRILFNVPQEQITAILANESVKTKYPQFIKNPSDFIHMFHWLTPEQKTQVFENKGVQEKLPQLIINTSDLIIVLCYLTPEQMTSFLANESVKVKLPQLFESAEHFSSCVKGKLDGLEIKKAITEAVVAALASDKSSIIHPETSRSPYAFQQQWTQETKKLPNGSSKHKHVPDKARQKLSS